MQSTKYIILIITLILFQSNLLSQPYIYTTGAIIDSSASLDPKDWIKSIDRINLSTNEEELFLYNGGIYNTFSTDQTQTWLMVGYSDWPSILYRCTDTLFNYDLPEGIYGGTHFLYSKKKNSLNNTGPINDQFKMLSLDIATKNIEQSFEEFPSIASNSKVGMFFSGNEEIIYVPVIDSITEKTKLLTYSTITKHILSISDLSRYGYPSANGYILYRGREGIGIVESYIHNPTKDSYFKVYNFDTDSSSNFILYHGYADPYFTNNGKYLILVNTFDSSNACTGIIDVYSATSGNPIKNLDLPSTGVIYTFDNYPNNLYYVKDLELPTRQIFTLKMDSIFNELNLSILTPSTATINSPPFTIAVKGRGFDSTSTVYFNGQTKTTTFVSDSLLTAQILSSDISVAGNFPVWVTDKWAVSDTLQFTVTQSSSLNLIVNLKSSQGALLTTGSLQYYEGSWKDAVNNGDGTFTVTTNLNTVSLRMAFEYGSQTVANINAHNNIYTFQTVNAAVQLKNSLGNLIDAGTVQYYSGAWRNFGTTTNGVANKELLPINYSFRMAYEFASLDKQQNISNDPTVVFQTVNASVQLKNSLGNLIDAGTVQYYSGAWRNFGATTNGVATKELLPINYSFRMVYEFASIDKQQNLLNNPTVVFQTVNAAVQLKNSSGNLIDAGTVQYYSGAWRNFGTTTNGVANKELLPINYSFRMAYEYVSNDKQQNLSTNPVVNFTTVLCSVKVSNTTNQPLSNANVKYYSGAWRDFGITNADGVTTKELLPANLSFRASVGNVSMDKQQDITANNLVEINLNTP